MPKLLRSPQTCNVTVLSEDVSITGNIKKLLKQLGYLQIDFVNSYNSVVSATPDLALIDLQLFKSTEVKRISKALKKNNIAAIYILSTESRKEITASQKSEPLNIVCFPINRAILYNAIKMAIYFRNQYIKEQKQNSSLNESLNKITEGVIIVSKEGIVEYINSAAIKLTGYRSSSVKGKYISSCLNLKNISTKKSLSDLLQSDILAKGNRDNKIFAELTSKAGRVKHVILQIHESKTEDGQSQLIIIFKDITEKQSIEQKLKISEKKYRLIIEKSLSGIYIVQGDKFIFTNRAISKISGYTQKELTSLPVIHFIHEDDKAKVIKNIRARLNGEIDSIHYSVRFKHKNGKIVYCEVSGGVIVVDNKPLIIGNLIDVTKQKAHIDEIKESEAKLREFAELLPQTVFECNINGKITFVNHSSYKMLGYNPDNSLIGTKITDFIYSNDSEPFKIKDIYKISLDDNSASTFKVKRKNGEIISVILSLTAVHKNDKVTGYRGIFFDITKQMEIEDKLRKFSRIVEYSPVSVLITDTSGIIEYVNPKFEETTGFKKEEIIGHKTNILNSGMNEMHKYEKLWSTILKGETWFGELLNKRKDGSLLWENISISPLFDEKNQISNFIAVKEDITSRKNYQEQLISAKEEAEKADMLKTEFLAQMSHEVRTPLNNILTYTQLLKEEIGIDLPEGLERIFNVIKLSSKRLIRTIELILDLSKIQTGNIETNFELLDVEKDIVDDILIEFHSRAKAKDLTLSITNKAENSVIFADQYTTSQVFANLIDNAIKYTFIGGIDITIYNENTNLCVDIKDSGIGIKKDFLPMLFSPFTQESYNPTNSYEGTGLGLALVRKYVEINNGQISVKSVKEKGTTFTVTFEQAN